jgi:hypothetical protein
MLLIKFVSLLAPLLLYVAILFAGPALATVSLIVSPDCPSPTQSVALEVSASDDLTGQLYVDRAGTTIRLVALRAAAKFIIQPAIHVADATLPPLAVGTYDIEVYVLDAVPTTYDPALVAARRRIVVSETPPACTPARIVITSGRFQVIPVGSSDFPAPLPVQVLDDLGRPVPHVKVTFNTISAGGEDLEDLFGNVFATLSSDAVQTDQNGFASIHAASSGPAGIIPVSVYVQGGFQTFFTSFTLAKLTTNYFNEDLVPVVEYYRYNGDSTWDFFLTSDSLEIEKLDSLASGWSRWGPGFLAYRAGRGLAFGAAPTCRFYGQFPYFAGSPPRQTDTLESHFFSADADECATVAVKYGDVWSLESTDAFDVTLPDRQSGVCPAATKPVYRLYDTYGLPPNHMYTTSRKARDDMATQAGWKPEGYGPDGVVMCTPK